MTVLSRGARVRRGGHRPGWLLLTALLVLAIGASSALVFTNRVELLKLAVILALWAAVVAAFVSVIYRRQSDVDQARVRDLKLVYDLQLDREISARREYELTVESQLRRELASELRAQAADEVAALRAELAALRTNLEILFDAELSHRPALETERTTVRSYSEWERQDESPRDRFDRVTSLRPEEAASRSEDRSIIDVPEEPLLPPPRPAAPEPAPGPYPAAGAYRTAETHAPSAEPSQAEGHGGSPWRQTEDSPWSPSARHPEQREWSQGRESGERRWSFAQERFAAQPERPAQRPHAAPPSSQLRFGETGTVAPQPAPAEPTGGDWHAAPAETPQRRGPASQWQPIGAEGHWANPKTPANTWVPERPDNPDVAGVAGNTANGSTAVSQPAPEVPRSGRHARPSEPPVMPPGGTAMSWGYGETSQRPRHSAEHGAGPPAAPPVPGPPPPESPLRAASTMSAQAEPTARHRSSDGPAAGPSSGTQSVAELLARLQAEPTGGRRRRREE
ncbi:membrane protein [Mycobacterium heckeshornense]|uniref:DUF6779 domain-containing protein n=1 Tax=Mycobacterium heckeshornense TaxID=110505 RepID=UPI0019422566|nr:DUF6779 domain-containing protein [Mycobacterium heckeshornense]BCQ07015.1 membrane protein [Mycobacterium heckeshornense]